MAPSSGRVVTQLVLLVSLLLLAVAARADEPIVNVLVMPVEFDVNQMTVGGVVEVLPDESEMACEQIDLAIRDWLHRHDRYRPVPFPPLSQSEQRTIKEHIALFNVAMNEAWTMLEIHERGRFDYTVGPGLKFLAAATGAQKTMVLAGSRVQSTGGRTAMKVLEFAVFGAISPLNLSFLSVGLIDLETGQVEWANLENVSGENVVQYEAACDAVDKLMAEYPGGKLSIGRGLP